MLKQMLLIGAAAISFPAVAQDAPAGSETATPPPASEPVPVEPAPAPDASTPPSQPAPSEAAPSGGAAATPTQVAQIVDKEFPTYDADSTGELNEAEFAAWMKKLRAATDPAADVESADVKTWIGQAFAAADGDKSKGVSKTELTGFLSRGA